VVILLTEKPADVYKSNKGHVIKREKGQIVDNHGNLVKVAGEWVMRDQEGNYLDRDSNRNDLFERHNFLLSSDLPL